MTRPLRKVFPQLRHSLRPKKDYFLETPQAVNPHARRNWLPPGATAGRPEGGTGPGGIRHVLAWGFATWDVPTSPSAFVCLGPEKSGKHLGCKPPCKADPDTPWCHSGPARGECVPRGYRKRPCMGVCNLGCFPEKSGAPKTCVGGRGLHLGCIPPCKADPATPWRHSGPAQGRYGPGGYPKRPCMGVCNLRCFPKKSRARKT